MKKKLVNLTLWVYSILMLILVISTNYYISSKDRKLKRQAEVQLERFFSWSNTQQVDLLYSKQPFDYEEVPVPSKPKNIKFEIVKNELGVIESIKTVEIVDSVPDEEFIKKLDEWNRYYSNLSRLYQLKDGYGWKIQFVQKIDSMISVTKLHPHQVGYKTQNHEFEYSRAIDEVVEEVLDVFLSNSQEKRDNKGGIENFEQLRRSIDNNEYYFLSYKIPDSTMYLKSENNLSYPDYAENEIVKVIFGKSQPHFFQLVKSRRASREKKQILMYGGILLTLLTLIIIVPEQIKEAKLNKLKNESIYLKLERLCNPSNFMKPYDKKKVEIANQIYSQLLNTPKDDANKLQEIRTWAMKDLGISFIDDVRIKNLIILSDPKNFMNPYNPEKVKIANDIFAKLTTNSFDIDEFEEFEEIISGFHKTAD